MIDSRTFRTLLTLTMASLALGVAGASAQQQDSPLQVEPGVVEPVEITVANENWSDMRIFALRHGKRHRLGTVNSFRSERFVLPPQVQTAAIEVRLIAVPIGSSPSVISPVILVNPGDELEWRLQANLAHSGTPIG